MKNKTNIRAYLNIAHSNVNFVSENQDRLSSYFEKINIVDYKFSTTRVDSGIELFDTNNIESLDAAKQVNKVLSSLERKFSNVEFKQFVKSNELKCAKIEVVINIYDGCTPSIFLDSKMIAEINLLNIEVEFDIYTYTSASARL